MSIDLLEDAAEALGELTEEVVFVGAATLAVWITDDAAPPLRGTADVDVVVEVATLIGFNRFEQRLREADFRDEGSMIGRFLFGPGESLLDVIPADASILGFENRWQRESLTTAARVGLPSGAVIRAASPAFLLAMKLEAFAGRGEGDFLGSHDFEDIVAFFDGRAALVAEVENASPELRRYVADELGRHLKQDRARDAVIAHLELGRDGRARAEIVMPRLEQVSTK